MTFVVVGECVVGVPIGNGVGFYQWDMFDCEGVPFLVSGSCDRVSE